MLTTAGSHLMRRGLEAHAFIQDKKVKIDVPHWFMATLAVTSVAYFLVSFSIEYTFGRLIPTLIMIESPEDHSFDPLPTEDHDNSMNKDPEHQVPRGGKYITSSFRQTIKLLQSKGGFRARYRGLAIFIVNNIAISSASGILSDFVFLRYLPTEITTIFAAVICAQLSLAWNHFVISEPSPKPWYRRLPAARMWKKVAGPTAVLAIAQQASVILPFALGWELGVFRHPNDFANLPEEQKSALVAKAIGCVLLSVLLGFLLVFPAHVALTRIQASLLDETEETIVPFDRSFGGKVIPEIVGGSGRIGMLDAWRTFNWAARVRLIKAYVKVIGMQIGVLVLFSAVAVCQVMILGGFHKIIVPADGHN